MTVWRPRQTIQVKALGLVWRDGRLLAGEIYSDDGSVKGVRPLGGGVEFGETWQDTLTREFKEELGADIEVLGKPTILENIYMHHGVLGHDVVFPADVRLLSSVQEKDGVIEFVEGRALWFDLRDLDCGGLELYPSGLKPLLLSRTEAIGAARRAERRGGGPPERPTSLRARRR